MECRKILRLETEKESCVGVIFNGIMRSTA